QQGLPAGVRRQPAVENRGRLVSCGNRPVARSTGTFSFAQPSPFNQFLEARFVAKGVILREELDLIPCLRLIEVFLEFVERFLLFSNTGIIAGKFPVTDVSQRPLFFRQGTLR